MARKKSYLTVTDQFCGAGGSSLGAVKAGLEVRMALNHWQLAIDTHNTNFPNTDHDCTDISACDPRRYPSTDILITSPECTTHSPAGGNHHRKPHQRDLFAPAELKPETQRSRATMWDVVRFAEYHAYEAIIVENVMEVTRWLLFWEWWAAMERLGYVGQMISLNSMFALPTPQSRDRVYIVWTKKKNRLPDVRITPLAPCAKCGDVEARQTWKGERRVGKYGDRNQYIYSCPKCHAPVQPYYYCALNALDFSIPAQRIGDRDRPLRPRTLERVRYGLEKYGRRALQVTVNNKSGVACRVRAMEDPLFAMTTSNTTALIAPWVVGLSQSGSSSRNRVRSSAGAMPTQTTTQDLGLAGFTPFMVTNRSHAKAKSLADAHAAMCTGYHHALVQPAAMVRLMGSRAVAGFDAPLPTQLAGHWSHDAVLAPSPFLIQYYGTNNAAGVDDSVPAITTKDRHALISPKSIDVEDCYFRMIVAREVGAAMAFPSTYTVLGTHGQQIKQYGNAVTPPAMELLIQRVTQSLTGERAA